MSPATVDTELEDFVDAFESANQCRGQADLDSFLPPTEHPNYLSVVRELVCVDLDYGWARGEPTHLDDYRRRFPGLFADPDTARAVVWEDYRQRRQAGQAPDREDYRRRYGVSLADPDAAVAPVEVAPAIVAEWAARLDGLGSAVAPGAADLYQATCQSDPAAAEQYARAITALPRVGETFAGFRLEAELGRGTFGRVFLARQIALADRPVALKVSGELFGEDQTLAQLQHTNIVPIYSPHRVGPLQAVAMPYFGGTTLADVFKALGGHALPASGKHFVSTLQGRRNSTVLPPAASGLETDRSLSRKREDLDPEPPAPLATEALANLERFTYPDAVLWLGARLADGLAHAHERGIIHRDLKPANVLLKDDGQPMLLDFNLAESTTLRSSEAGARVGGTLPYMAPEQIRAFHKIGERLGIDGRGDIYSLGLILFELLTGRTAYPVPSPRSPAENECGSDDVAKMLIDRSGSPPRLQALNPAVSPAAEAIIRHCLEPDPADRYQSARDLQEDIDLHLAHLPLKHVPEPSLRERLKKWGVRHPRLTSGTSVAMLAAAVLIALGAAAFGLHRDVQRRVASDGLRDLMTQSDAVLPRLIRSLDAGNRTAAIAAAQTAIAPYGVLDRPGWQTGPLVSHLPPADQDRLRGRVGELLFLMAQNEADGDNRRLPAALKLNDLAAAAYGPAPPRAWWEQRATLLIKSGAGEAAAAAAAEAKQLDLKTPADLYLAALRLYEAGKFAEALPLLNRATTADPRHFWAWFLRGNCHFFQGQTGEAAQCYSVCIGLDPAQARPYFNRSRALTAQKVYRPAVEDADRAAKLDPDWVDAQIEAALVRYRLALALARAVNVATTQEGLLGKAGAGLPADQKKLLLQAEERFTEILRRPDAPVRCYFHRATVRQILGDKTGADADRAGGLGREPAAEDEDSWIMHGLNCPAGDAERALADFRRAERINPQSFNALKNQANVLSARLKRPEEALAALNRLLALFPESSETRASRAVVLARLGRMTEALADAEWVKAHTADPMEIYQIGGVYALAGNSGEALRLLATALSSGVGFNYLATDPELDPIRGRPEFIRLVDAVRTVQDFLKPAAQAPAGSVPR